jgi:hypothetical protein
MMCAGLVMAGAAILITTAITPPAAARVTAAEGTAAACTLDVGSVTEAGDHTYRQITAGAPPTIKVVPARAGAAVYAPGQVRLSSTFVNIRDILGTGVRGWVVQGDALYRSHYLLERTLGRQYLEPPEVIRIGGGWTNFKFVDEAEYIPVEHGQVIRTSAYGLRNDGMLFRWKLDGLVWRRTGSAGGFGSVKTMALISKTRTYDTFLVNTRGGALYTVRIPTTSPMKPIVKPVRTATWHVFEKLIAAKCGIYGTLLLGIDKDSKSGYLYAVGHTNGLATVIKGLGKVQGTFADPVDFRWRWDFDPLNGD